MDYFSWYIWIDWDGDESPDGGLEDVSSDWQTATWSVGATKPFQLLADEAQAVITLKNADGKYTPENTSSPLYGKVVPGRLVQIMAVDPVEGGQNMYLGRIERIEPDWQPGAVNVPTVRLVCVGHKQQLQDTEVPGGVWQDVTGDVIVQDMLAAAGLTGTASTGKTVLPLYAVGAGRTAYDVIAEITEAERGRFRESKTGVAEWIDRHAFLNLNTVPVALIIGSQEAIKPAAVDYSFGDLLVNDVRVTGTQTTLETAAETLWTLETALAVPPGELYTFEVVLRKANGQFASATGLTLGTLTYTGGSLSASVAAKGGVAVVTLSNAGTTTAIVTALTVDGTPMIKQNALTAQNQDTGSIAAYGRRQMRLSLSALSNFDLVRQVALYELRRRSTLQGVVNSVVFRNAADGVANRHQYQAAYFPLVTVRLPELGHEGDYIMIGEKHTISPGLHETTFYLEPSDPNRYWILGRSGYSELNQTTRLGY